MLSEGVTSLGVIPAGSSQHIFLQGRFIRFFPIRRFGQHFVSALSILGLIAHRTSPLLGWDAD
jgi:hypothetical protein